ncbi:MAG: sulfatase, partial [Roseibacillus sp.]|nr:sulfatase [Roseibacillus sp.]
GEQTDLASLEEPRVGELRAALDAWLAETGARLPKKDARFDSVRRKQQDAVIKSKRLPQLEKQHANFLDPAFQPNPSWWGSKVTQD